VTLCGAANFVLLGISFMGHLLAALSKASTAKTGDHEIGRRPLRPFAGMTRIRFKGFGFPPSQPRSGRPSSKRQLWPRQRGLSTPLATSISVGVLRV
jgi:hypothetical protein